MENTHLYFSYEFRYAASKVVKEELKYGISSFSIVLTPPRGQRLQGLALGRKE